MYPTKELNRLASHGKHCDKKQTSKVKHRKPDVILKYVLVFQILIRFATFDAIDAIEKMLFKKIYNKV